MAVTQIQYDAGAGYVLLPHPAHEGGFVLRSIPRGGHIMLADGTMSVDLVSAREFAIDLFWQNISQANRDLIVTFYNAAYGIEVDFKDPGNTVHADVMVMPGTELVEEWSTGGGSTLIYNVRLTLRQNV